MLLTTIALAVLVSSQFPDPFNQGNGTYIVIGNDEDRSAAQLIRSELIGEGQDGESLIFERATDRLNLGESLSDLQRGAIDEDDFPTLLAQGEYESDEGDAFDYDQEISLSDNIVFTVFQDNDYRDNDPSIGIFIENGENILNYTVDFTDPVDSNIEDGNLVDFEDTQIEMLGNQFTIISATSASRFEMLSGATEGSLNLGETRTFVDNGTSYDIEAVFINQNQARLRVNGELTRSLGEGDTATIRGTTIAVTEIDYQDFAGGVQRVQFLIGAKRITIANDQEVEIADNNVEGLIAHIDSSVSGDQYELRRITFDWNADDDMFIAEDLGSENNGTVTMPLFEDLRFIMEEFVTPVDEELLVESVGDDTISLNVMLEGSDNQFELPILFSDGNTFTAIGGDIDDDLLVTSSGDTVTWDDDTDEYLVASWDDENSAESFILRLDVGTEEGDDVVDFFNQVTGDEEESNVREGDSATFGEIELTVVSINEDNNVATISINEGGSFDKLYTEEGLKMLLPVEGNATAVNSINLGTDTEWTLMLTEEDEDGDIGVGQNFSLVLQVDTSGDEVEVGSVENVDEVMAGGIFSSLEEDSDIQTGWIESPLASQILLDSGTDQTSATVIYHGEESYGRVSLISGEGNTTSGDVEIIFSRNLEDNIPDRNLIVVGGTCANNLSATLLGVDFPLCGDDWEEETSVGRGEYVIRTFESPFGDGMIATMVAGYDREDTLSGASYLINQRPEISVGEEFIGTSGQNGNNNNTNNGV